MARNNRSHFDSDGDNSAQAVKTSRGWIEYIQVHNPNTAVAYLQLFDAATASVTVGTTTPLQSYMIPPGDGSTPGAFEVTFGQESGLAFYTAITYACTTTATGSTDPTTGLVVNVVYE